MVLARVEGEVRRHGEEKRALERQNPVQLGEAEVVTDGEAARPALDLGDDRFLARLLRVRLAVDVAAGLDVEQMDLAVDGGDLAFGIEDDARVRELLAALPSLGDRA